MARVFAFNAIFFLLPFAIYAGWLVATRGTANDAALWPVRTIGFLALGGLILMAAGLIVFIHFSDAPPEAAYRPATMGEDGRVVPGSLE